MLLLLLARWGSSAATCGTMCPLLSHPHRASTMQAHISLEDQTNSPSFVTDCVFGLAGVSPTPRLWAFPKIQSNTDQTSTRLLETRMGMAGGMRLTSHSVPPTRRLSDWAWEGDVEGIVGGWQEWKTELTGHFPRPYPPATERGDDKESPSSHTQQRHAFVPKCLPWSGWWTRR